MTSFGPWIERLECIAACKELVAVGGRRDAVGVTATNVHVFPPALLEKQGKVIYKWTLEGTNGGPSGTGKRVRISGFEEWRIGNDGLVAESLGNFDAAEYQRQVEHGIDGK